jgi:lipoprotein-anchoring transpeptidase ErfK/SrfK
LEDKVKRIIVIAIPLLVLAAGIFLLFNMYLRRAGSGDSRAVSGFMARAKELETKGKLLEAKTVYQNLMGEFPGAKDILAWQKKIEELNIKLLFSPTITPSSVLYEIKPGDSLVKIANEFKTNAELIMKSNHLTSDRIMPGQKVKVWTAPFSIFVDKSQNTLILKTNEEIIKTYVVSTGANNCSPELIANPPWFKPGAANPIPAGSPENILGTRWLGLNIPGYGIHGTTDPQALGTQVTQGCVRMANQDVEELFSIVPKGTEVIIVD